MLSEEVPLDIVDTAECYISRPAIIIPVTPSTFTDLHHFMSSVLENKLIADITVDCRGTCFRLHKFVLMGRSTYFHDKLAGLGAVDKLNLDMEPRLFGLCVDYLYNGTVNIESHLSKPMADVCAQLGIPMLLKDCQRFEIMDVGITVFNCLKAFSLGLHLQDEELVTKSKSLVLSNFHSVVDDEFFLELSYECIREILTNSHLELDAPEERLEAAFKWLEHDPGNRIGYLEDLLTNLPLESMADWFLLSKKRDKLVKGNEAICQILVDAVNAMKNQSRELCMIMVGMIRNTVVSQEVYSLSASLNGDPKAITKVPASVPANGGVACCIDKDSLVVSGLGGACDEAWRFDLNTYTWSSCGKLSGTRRRHCMIACQGAVFVLGGCPLDEGYVLAAGVEKMGTGSDMWSEVGEIQGSKCYNTSCCLLNDTDILVFGACERLTMLHLQVYSTVTNTVSHCLTTTIALSRVIGLSVVKDHVIMTTSRATCECSVSNLLESKRATMRLQQLGAVPNTFCFVVLTEDSKHCLAVGGTPKEGTNHTGCYRASVDDLVEGRGGWEKMEAARQIMRESIVMAGGVCCGRIPSKLMK